MKLLLCSLALAFAMEGVALALFPSYMRKIFEEAMNQPENALRRLGCAALVAAAILAALAKFL